MTSLPVYYIVLENNSTNLSVKYETVRGYMQDLWIGIIGGKKLLLNNLL